MSRWVERPTARDVPLPAPMRRRLICAWRPALCLLAGLVTLALLVGCPATTTVAREAVANPVAGGASSTPASAASEQPGNTSETPPLPAPEPRAAAAAKVLERHCVRCHAPRSLETGEAPAGGIGNINSLDEIARDPTLISPGDADASLLYQQMISRQMPSDVLRSGQPGEVPQAAEVRAVRDWIGSLQQARTCPQRQQLDAAALSDLARNWLAELEDATASATRFVSLAHIAAQCASDAELSRLRDGVVRLVNSLSWQKEPVRVDTVGDDLVLMAIRLDRLGWTAEHWRLVTEGMPVTARIDTTEEVRRKTGTDAAIVPADWFANMALQPRLNAKLLGLPKSLLELARLIGVDMEEAREARGMRRAIVLKSRETGSPRAIERYPARFGALWLALDYVGLDTPEGLLEHPLLPWAPERDEEALGPLAMEPTVRVMFNLPNGSPAFAQFDANENLVAGVEGETGQPAGPRRACRTCHGAGPLAFTDELGPHLAGERYAGSDVERQIAKRLVPSTAEINSLIADDRFAAMRSPVVAAVQASLDTARPDPVTELAAYAKRDADLSAAAQLLLRPEADLRQTLEAYLDKPEAGKDPQTRTSALRLLQGRLRREALDRLLDGMTRPAAPTTGPAKPEAASASSAPAVSSDSRLRLDLWAEQSARGGGATDLVTINAKASAPCHLTIINIEPDGTATVLFPNEFDRDNLLKPDVALRVPSATAAYRFARKANVAERFVGICEAGEPVPAGIVPDLTRQNFTPLGDWQLFLDRAYDAATQPRARLDNGGDRDRRRGRAPPPSPPPQLSPAQARAAITLPP